ncbi:AMP-binding protein [Saccharothrix australiensis]|uniref:Nonribosomal peptide synthetase protein VioO n=1 Tax=Saccharothrix australiensis TaxID=2072 RepID=A0A495W984_9PSEU|nr:AMP-binding protein [Saccharothrix australiensis]RKT57774.1 nonribosomal peptide synthetase protein VioO [Saccharothrix australiensis]
MESVANPRIVAEVVRDVYAIAAAEPRRTAIVHNGEVVDYATLADWIRSTAGLVRAAGPSPAPVAIIEAFTPRTIAAALGVWAAGRAYCALDPAAPVSRLETLVRDLGCTQLISTSAEDRVPEVAEVIRPEWTVTSGGGEDVLVPVSPEDPAYVLYTSGSTGTPKAAVVPFRAIAAVVPELVRLYDVRPDDRVLHFTPLFWDTSLEELLPAFGRGAAVLMDDQADIDLHYVLAEYEVSVLNLPTSFWNEFVGFLLDEELELPKTLRTVVIGGEQVRLDMVEQWRRLGADHVRLLNTYGSTETALVTHAWELSGPGVAPGREVVDVVPIGAPLPHVDQKLVHEGRVVTEPGAEGELYLAGDNIALGYHARDELNAERFPVLDLGDGPKRYFRTRDLVAATPSGALVFRGRADLTIKVRGIRVDIGEIEFWIGRHPGVASVVVVEVEKNEHNGLVAFVVPRREADPDALPREVIAHLRANVPPYLVPGAVRVVPELVHTRTRKIDRDGTRARYADDLA